MRRVIIEKGQKFDQAYLNRTGAFDARALSAATEIIEEVRKRKDDALRDFTLKFDGVEITNFKVENQAIDEAIIKVSDKTAQALRHAAKQIEDYHQRQLQQSWFTVRADGALLGSKIQAIESVGIYVPGGRALYPSSVLMNAIPAAVAGVERIVCVTPPTKSGELDPAIIEACRIAGVTEIYAVGGAQAIAALAYGTESIAPVSKITGPGNAYVAAAKKLVSGDVGIDMIAGPSEICIVSDETIEAELVAIDLMSQAEHDPLASSYLVTFSNEYADEVERAIEKSLADSKRAEITKQSLDEQGLIIVCEDIETAFDAVNTIAPEHLEILLDNAFDLLGKVVNAGAIFLGKWTPEAVGDYVAGPNHILPTGGTARFSSPLSVDEFMKKSSVIKYSPQALMHDADAITTIAEHEGLWAHAKSVEMRKNIITSEVMTPDGLDDSEYI